MTEQTDIIEAEVLDHPEDPDAPLARIHSTDPNDVIALAEEMEERANAYATIRRHALLVTFPEDWMTHDARGGSKSTTAFLQSKGAQRIANFLGINRTEQRMERVDREDSKGKPFYQYEATATFSWLGRSITVTGGASSRHKLLSRGGRIPSEDVDERDVRTMAQTNLVRLGVTELLGLKDFPISELPQKTRDGRPFRELVGGVQYRGGSQGGDTSSDSEKDMRAEVVKLLTEMTTSPQEAQDALEQITEFKGKDGEMVKGIRSSKALKGKRLEVTLGKVRDAHAKWQASQ